MPSWTIFYVWMFWPALLLAVGAAMKWGGPAEKWAGIAYLGAAVTETLVRAPLSHAYRTVDVGVASVDLGLLIALIVFLVRYERRWLYAASALQFVVVTAHIAKLTVPGMSRLAYAIMTGSGGYPSLLLLAVGTATFALHPSKRRPHTH